MRLAAVYIPSGVLPHIFEDEHEGQTLNFGGENRFAFSEKENEISVFAISHNHNFIKDFWGKDISLISAVVGRNGIGKTSILRAIHSSGDKEKKDVVYLFQGDKDEIFIYNELKKKSIKANFEFSEIKTNALNSVKFYYTPIVDSEQKNTLSQLNLVSNGKEDLSKLYLKQLRQDVILLNDPIKETLKKVYPDFPEYKELEITVSQHRKFDFKNVYATANLGNQNRYDVLKTYIESDIGDMDNGKWDEFLNSKSFIKDNFLKRYVEIINSSGLNSLFDRVWNIKEYKNLDDTQNIHDGKNFIKNFEVTLFSYFIVDATFPQTPFQGTYEFKNIIDFNSFEDRFNGFIDLYFSSIYSIVRENIISKLGKIDILDYDQLKSIINEDGDRKWSQQGFKSEDAVKLMLKYLERFKVIYDLYLYLKALITENKFEKKDSGFVYKLNKHNEKDFYTLIKLYNKVVAETRGYVYTLNLLSIRCTYPMSSGEKSLLSFFSRINNRVNILSSSGHVVFDYFLLLLDEPELGYHPIWKRKFIDAITKSLPIIFNKLKPTKSLVDKDFTEVNDLKLQIIFTTHDPLTLSDIPNSNVIFLDKKNETGNAFIVENNKKANIATFGANVHDLLAHSFFLEAGFMGEFAQELITDLINYLTFSKNESRSEENIKPIREWSIEKAENIIEIIDEPLIKERVQSLYDKKVLYQDKKLLALKIEKLKNQLNKLENEES